MTREIEVQIGNPFRLSRIWPAPNAFILWQAFPRFVRRRNERSGQANEATP